MCGYAENAVLNHGHLTYGMSGDEQNLEVRPLFADHLCGLAPIHPSREPDVSDEKGDVAQSVDHPQRLKGIPTGRQYTSEGQVITLETDTDKEQIVFFDQLRRSRMARSRGRSRQRRTHSGASFFKSHGAPLQPDAVNQQSAS
jgi:hypothetical protein